MAGGKLWKEKVSNNTNAVCLLSTNQPETSLENIIEIIKRLFLKNNNPYHYIDWKISKIYLFPIIYFILFKNEIPRTSAVSTSTTSCLRTTGWEKKQSYPAFSIYDAGHDCL